MIIDYAQIIDIVALISIRGATQMDETAAVYHSKGGDQSEGEGTYLEVHYLAMDFCIHYNIGLQN